MLKMDLEYEGGILFIRLIGDLNKRTNYKINNYILPILKKHSIKNVIYNLKYLKSIDESGISAILRTKCIVKNNFGKIYLCEINNSLSKILKVVHIKNTSSEIEAKKQIEV